LRYRIGIKDGSVAQGALTPNELDRFAETYYLNGDIDDVDIEELAQTYSVPNLVAAIGGRRTLEMGYGTGLITGALLTAGVELEVLEGSARLCEIADERHGAQGLRVHQSMFEDFVPTQLFGAVLALHVLEHVDDAPALVRHIAQWVEPGGVVVAVTPNAQSIHRQLGVRMGLHDTLDALSPRDHLVGHRRVYDLDGLTADITAAGLEVTNVFGYFVKPLSNAMMLEWPREVLEGLNAIADVVPAWLCANIGVVAIKP
jgi:2-polyprenyl-3-methyl-5-hydroxy-6-metoxy-1,4-benzoquinol methylase